MKILSMATQAQIFLMTVASGFIIGFVFDCLRVFRRTVKHPNFLTQIEDIVFWVAVSLFMFYVMLTENYGEIRFYAILGAAIGAVIYFETLSRLFLPVSVAIVNFIKKVLQVTFNILLAPFRFLVYLLSFPARFIGKTLEKAQNRTLVGLRRLKKYGRIKYRKVRKEFSVILKKT